jgi:hypothetical protein
MLLRQPLCDQPETFLPVLTLMILMVTNLLSPEKLSMLPAGRETERVGLSQVAWIWSSYVGRWARISTGSSPATSCRPRSV